MTKRESPTYPPGKENFEKPHQIDADNVSVVQADNQPTSLSDDPDYKRIKDELNQTWLERTGVKPLSGDHQDYMFGNPIDQNETTLVQDAENAFREQFADRAAEYDRNERVKAYDNINSDPAFQQVQIDITERTNSDSQVRALLKTGGDGGDTWNRINLREHIHGMNGFARQYPEKAQAYADRWNTFVGVHPEISSMNTAQWNTWCEQHPGAFNAMSDYRNMARAVEHVKRQQETHQSSSRVHETESKIDEIRTMIGLAGNKSETEPNSPLTRDKQRLSDLQLEDVVSEVRMSVPAELLTADREALSALQKELSNLPYVPGQDAREILGRDGENEGVMVVDTDAIVGSVSPAFRDWSTEYESRKGRIVDVAQEILKGTPESIEHVFHITDPAHGVKLKKISGPKGDLFFVADGTHRVAGSKLARLTELPAQVENMTELSELRTTDSALKSQWDLRIKKGFIRGKVEETTTPSGDKTYNLKIDSQVLPWMSLPQSKLTKLSTFYLDRYPNSLDDIRSFTTGEIIPKEALLNQDAMNLYLTDRWDEYRPKNQH